MPSNDDEIRKAITAAYNCTYRAKNLEAKRAYERAYYAKNREKLRKYKRSYKPKDPEALAAYQREYAKNNREAILEHKRRYREKNRGKLREAHHKYVRDENSGYKVASKRKIIKHAIDLETMAGRPRPDICDACGGLPDKGKSLHFDHCHQHGHFRGWLCRNCNLMLGYAKDDPNRLRKLIAYLKRTARGTASQFALPGL
jgi:hypothetical protein